MRGLTLTTNKQLQDWLKRFPDDAVINVITSQDNSRAYAHIIDVYEEELELPDIPMPDLTFTFEHKHVGFNILYDLEQGCTDVTSITLGKHYNG